MTEENIIYRIRELDPDMIPPSTSTMNNTEQGGSKIIVIGKPGSGKSFLISSLIYEKSHIFPVGMVFNGTEQDNHHYEKYFPPLFIYNSFDKEKLEDFLKRQTIAKEHLANPWALLVIDDCMDDPKLFNDPVVQRLFKNGRHSKLFAIMGLQYSLDLRPTIRVNVDGVFIFREPNIKFRKILWENYGSIIPEFSLFCSLMDELTTDRQAIYIHNAGQSNKIEDCVFWYKAKEVPATFKVGSDEYWAYSKERFNH